MPLWWVTTSLCVLALDLEPIWFQRLFIFVQTCVWQWVIIACFSVLLCHTGAHHVRSLAWCAWLFYTRQLFYRSLSYGVRLCLMLPVLFVTSQSRYMTVGPCAARVWRVCVCIPLQAGTLFSLPVSVRLLCLSQTYTHSILSFFFTLKRLVHSSATCFGSFLYYWRCSHRVCSFSSPGTLSLSPFLLVSFFILCLSFRLLRLRIHEISFAYVYMFGVSTVLRNREGLESVEKTTSGLNYNYTCFYYVSTDVKSVREFQVKTRLCSRG